MIDWDRVRELRNEVGASDFEDVVELFLEEVGEVIKRLESDPNPGTLEQDLHFLKGSALSLGFRAFSALCQDGERLSADGEADSVDVGRIVSGFHQSRDQFIQKFAVCLGAGGVRDVGQLLQDTPQAFECQKA